MRFGSSSSATITFQRIMGHGHGDDLARKSSFILGLPRPLVTGQGVFVLFFSADFQHARADFPRRPHEMIVDVPQPVMNQAVDQLARAQR